jgi:hypothetical protein
MNLKESLPIRGTVPSICLEEVRKATKNLERYPVFRPRFEPSTFGTQVRSVAVPYLDAYKNWNAQNMPAVSFGGETLRI